MLVDNHGSLFRKVDIGRCFQQMSSLVTMYLGMYCFIKYTWMLWPALLIESSYALGMAILTMATAPKLLEAIGSRADQDFYFRLSIFLTGMLCNWLFTFALWHYYWFIEDRLRERQNRQLFEIWKDSKPSFLSILEFNIWSKYLLSSYTHCMSNLASNFFLLLDANMFNSWLNFINWK